MILSKFLSQKNKDKIKKFFFIFKCRLRRTVRFVIPFENKHKKERGRPRKILTSEEILALENKQKKAADDLKKNGQLKKF